MKNPASRVGVYDFGARDYPACQTKLLQKFRESLMAWQEGIVTHKALLGGHSETTEPSLEGNVSPDNWFNILKIITRFAPLRAELTPGTLTKVKWFSRI